MDCRGRYFKGRPRRFVKLVDQEYKKMQSFQGNEESLSNEMHYTIFFFYKKEVKVEFKNDEKVNDAGGLLREWITLILRELVNPELGINGQLLQIC